MKRYVLIPVAFALSMSGWAAAADGADASPVSVEFHEPEKYTDASDRGYTRRLSESVERQLRLAFQQQGERYLGEGQTLSIEILDVDLAGRFEPTRFPELHDARFMREITWPRLHFRYTLRDGETVLRSDEVELSDMNYLSRPKHVRSQGSLTYDKRMIEEWFGKTFGADGSRGAPRV